MPDQQIAPEYPAAPGHEDRPWRGRTAERRLGLLLALAAVTSFAAAAVLIRWAAPVPSTEITFWRLAIAAAVVALVATLHGQRPAYRRRDVPVIAGIGLVTAVHFLAFVAAVSWTTVAHALSLVYTAPIFVAALAAWRLGEQLTRRQLAGVGVAIIGIAILTGFEPSFTPTMVLGDLLALISAVAFGVYSVAGRGVRDRYPLLTYTAGVYGAAAIWLFPIALMTFEPARYTPTNSLAILALGIVPLGVGHTLYNAALRRLPAAIVNIIATQEVTGGVMLAWLLLAEVPSTVALVGAVVTLAGVTVVLLPQRRD